MKDGLTLTLTWKESIRGFGIYMLHEEKKARLMETTTYMKTEI